MEGTLNRVLFLQESNDPITSLTVSLELDKKYSADEIGHFRAFFYLTLKEPKHKILSILFGASDKPDRMRDNQKTDFTKQRTGIKYGIGSGQWEQHIDFDEAEFTFEETIDEEDENWTAVGSGSSIGREEVEFLPISYSKSSFIRFFPVISLRDLDDAMFLPFLNKTMAEKVKSIHIYSNGYKLQEIKSDNIRIDKSSVEPDFPVAFSKDELEDQWVRIRPQDASAYNMHFFENTPKRLFTPSQVENSLENRKP